MNRNRNLYFLYLITIMISFCIGCYLVRPDKETIIYFPLHPKAHFLNAKTQLSAEPLNNSPFYNINWSVTSLLDRKAYLRQDAGLLFEDGKLKSIIGPAEWKQTADTINETRTFTDKSSHLFQAIAFHYGEIHEKQKITSVQQMSHDSLYVIQTANNSLYSFRQAQDSVQVQWERELNQKSQRYLHLLWKKGMEQWSLKADSYTSIPLTDLYQYNSEPLPGFTRTQSDQIIGRLWEGLYKQYITGIKKEDGTVISPINSAVPLVLINPTLRELLVLIPTEQYGDFLLKQRIP
ncbi:hypothetical protein [Heyndrickxia acidicola]|uniref:Uncharacterized protein n=1 Tax=Heyndrickxia acidicola TaxID=209389 RepID=A0ABU6MKC3_9BACI|nr:hypothetical protein [Heyndrickxia acidicola]MED1205135.1 hypothetical protein [Heyndrickxia acidicola]